MEKIINEFSYWHAPSNTSRKEIVYLRENGTKYQLTMEWCTCSGGIWKLVPESQKEIQ